MRQYLFLAAALGGLALTPNHGTEVASLAAPPAPVAKLAQADPPDGPGEQPAEAGLPGILEAILRRLEALEAPSHQAGTATAPAGPLAVKIIVPAIDMVCGDLCKLKLELTGEPGTIKWQTPEGLDPESGERIDCTEADYEVAADSRSLVFSKRRAGVYRFTVAVATRDGQLELARAEIELVPPEVVVEVGEPEGQASAPAPEQNSTAQASTASPTQLVPLSETIARLLNQTPNTPAQKTEQAALAACFRDEAKFVSGGGVATGTDPMASLESRVVADLGKSAGNWSSFLAGLRQSLADRQQHGELTQPADWATTWAEIGELLQPS